MELRDLVGLCLTCRWARASTNRRDSTFYRCSRAEADPRFTRYPPLPVRSCPGYEVTMFFVVLMHYSKPLADVDRIRAEHIAHVQRAAGRGILVAWARRSPPVGGVLVATAPDRKTLEAVLAEDPYVKAGVASPEVVEFNPANVRGPFAS